MALVGLHFRYYGGYKPETFPFYKRLRGFLRWHRGQVAWIKGGIGKRDAYLVLTLDLVRSTMRMISRELEQGGRFFVRPVNPFMVSKEAEQEEREVLGWISADGISLGQPDRIFCPQKRYEEISTEVCEGLERGFKCPCWIGGICNWPKGYDWLRERVKSGVPAEQLLARKQEVWAQ